MILELHVKTFTNSYLQREHLLKRERKLNPGPKKPLFSEFSDKSQWDGRRPSGRWLASVFQAHHETIRNFMDREVQKRPATRLHWDVSYKEANHLGRFNVEKVSKGLATATNKVQT